MSVVGVSKFTAGPDGWPGWFETWGYPGWFLVVVGASEAGGALLLLVPRLAFYAAGLLMVVMIGALGTELLNERILGPVAPMIHIGLLTVIGFARRPDRLRRTKADTADKSGR